MSYQFTVQHQANGDLVATGYATTFNDDVTRSGVSAATPGIVACSLPTGRHPHTAGSPFPKLDLFQLVRVFNPNTNRIIYAPLIDEGPSLSAEAGTGVPGSAMIDLTPTAKLLLGFEHADDNRVVRIRVLAGHVWRREMVTDTASLFHNILNAQFDALLTAYHNAYEGLI